MLMFVRRMLRDSNQRMAQRPRFVGQHVFPMCARVANSCSNRSMPSAVLLCQLMCTFLLCTKSLAQDEPAAQNANSAAQSIEFFEKSIRPLIIEHCFECHAGDESKGGLRLDSRDALLAGGDSGAALVPGNPSTSKLIEAVRYKNLDLQMPPKAPLSQHEIELLERWIQADAPFPSSSTSGTGNKTASGMSIEEGRRFWSMQPISDPEIPKPSNESWIQNPIDAFIAKALESNALTPAPPADKRSLIRRATYDLTGLPPTISEIEAFLADESPDAFSKVIDRLLQSPDYGVRWGRHWLDVARYADSNGLDENLAYGTAWRYRDYVVNAFNHDKPYHQFVTEQIAGDLLPYANNETKTATGYLVLGAKVLAEPDREKLTMDTIDEQLDSLGKTFLGMTFGCVRCHDHKFDPIKQSDYYALAAIFKSTKTFGDTNYGAIKHWNEHVFASEKELAELKEVDAAIAKKQAAANTFKAETMNKIRELARSKATEYLIAATRVSLDSSLSEIKEIAEPLGLHPRILHHCRRHLEFHRESPFFRRWYELAKTGDVEAIDSHYRPLFADAQNAWTELKKTNPSAKELPDERLETARRALFDNSGFLTVPAKASFAFDEATLDEYNKLAEEARVLESFSPDIPSAMGVSESATVHALPIHIRGSHRNLGESIARDFPAVMKQTSSSPILPKKQSGRLELANWIASSDHPLTARVYVNRVWGWHFGNAIVRSTENFGTLGDRPTHPELLDWLARTFIESGWSTKELHRLIMNSNTYQMSTLPADKDRSLRIDAENTLLSRFPTLRLDAEQIRDSILFATGRLDRSFGGKSIPLRNRQFVFDHTSIDHTKYDSLRRAIYLPVVRNNVYTLFEQFDFPDPTMPTGHRNTTTVAPQALFMLNSELVTESAKALATLACASSEDTLSRIQYAYREALGRSPTDNEIRNAQQFISSSSPPNSSPPTQLPESQSRDTRSLASIRWNLFCQNLLCCNEFFFLR